MTTGETNVIECIQEYGDGDYDKAIILVDGNRLTPERSLGVWRHSPTGFAWGYGGSGPAQLALAILLACGVSEQDAVPVHQDFKREFIETLPQDKGWRFEVDVPVWVGCRLAEQGLA